MSDFRADADACSDRANGMTPTTLFNVVRREVEPALIVVDRHALVILGSGKVDLSVSSSILHAC